MKRWITGAVVAALLVPALSGCTDHNAIKQTVQQAIAKQPEVKTYKFAGSAELKLGINLASPDGNPLTGALLNSLKESKIEWSGTSNSNPVQFEADIKLTPKGGSPIAIPVIIKDSKLYFNLPTINKPDEYYVVDMAHLGQRSQSPLTPENLKNTSQVTTALWTKFAESIDAKWFEQAKAPITLPDGKQAKAISVNVGQNNEKDINALLAAKLPEVADVLQSNGLLSSEQAAKWKAAKTSIQLHSPTKLTLLIDGQGFIRDEQLDLVFMMKNADGSTTENQATLHESFDQINQTPVFQKDVPKQTKPFDDILKLIKPKK